MPVYQASCLLKVNNGVVLDKTVRSRVKTSDKSNKNQRKEKVKKSKTRGKPNA